MLRQRHVASKFDQDSLHGILPLPLSQTGQARGVYLACAWIDAGDVDLGDELDSGGNIGVVLPTVNVNAVDAVLMRALARPSQSTCAMKLKVRCEMGWE